jgi:RNA polymerase sigma-70 factor (ECF subfamily)
MNEVARSALSTDADAAWKGYIERCAAGDQSALAQLYDESSSLVFSLAFRVLGDRADAEEITSDVYAQVWRQAATYDPSRGKASTWLATLVRSRAIDRLRSRGARDKYEIPDVRLESIGTGQTSPERETEFAQRRRRVVSALATLSEEQREVIQLAFFSGLTHSELADRLGQPLGTVKTRIRLGMLKLREQLEEYAL